MLPHGGGDDIAIAHQRRAAMMEHHALGIARGTGCVVERDCVPFVVGHAPGKIRIAAFKEFLVFEGTEKLATLREFAVVIVDDEGLHFRELQRFLDNRRKFAVGDQHLCLAVIENEGERYRIEPRVEGVEHAARHRHAVMSFQHGRNVGQHHCNRVGLADAVLRKSGRQPARAGVEVRIAKAKVAVDDGRAVRKHAGRALQKRDRSERLVVGGVLVEIALIRIERDGGLAALGAARAAGGGAANMRLARAQGGRGLGPRLVPGRGLFRRRFRACKPCRFGSSVAWLAAGPFGSLAFCHQECRFGPRKT